MYFIDYKLVSDRSISLGVPTEIIYPLAFAKILGVATIWLIKNILLNFLLFFKSILVLWIAEVMLLL